MGKREVAETGVRHLAHLSPQVFGHSRLLCPHKGDDRTGRGSSRPTVWRSTVCQNYHNHCAEVVG